MRLMKEALHENTNFKFIFLVFEMKNVYYNKNQLYGYSPCRYLAVH